MGPVPRKAARRREKVVADWAEGVPPCAASVTLPSMGMAGMWGGPMAVQRLLSRRVYQLQT
ncbi:hypothetical protein D3C71_1709250 [compost metagenome]